MHLPEYDSLLCMMANFLVLSKFSNHIFEQYALIDQIKELLPAPEVHSSDPANLIS